MHQPFSKRQAVDQSFPAVPLQKLLFAFKGYFSTAMQELVQEHLKKYFIVLFYGFYKNLWLFFQCCQKSKILLGFIAIFNSLDDKVPETDFLMALLLS